MSKYMLNDEDAINDVNPFVTHDFSLPGGVGQTGDFADFSKTRKESGIEEPSKSVFCDYALCKGVNDRCPLSKPLHPRRNIDRGFVVKRPLGDLIRVGVANKPRFSITGWLIILIFIFTILYYIKR
tara:strand:+ start:1191 stop:1568 length:378 start_codon:yes stop_codon:yes gene_type:complete